MYKYVSAEEALSIIKSNHRVFLHGSACTPNYLITELAKQAGRLRDVEVVSITVQGEIEIAKPQYKDSFYINSLFVSTPVREAVNSDRGDYVPVFLSEIPLLFKKKILSLDVAIVQVSPPDQHGYCSLGTSIDVARSAVDNAKMVIAQVNPKMPRTFGDSMIHVERITKMVLHETDLLTIDYSAKVTEDETKIGQYIAGLIDDKSTIQMGVGTIPDAVLSSLHNHKNLGIHTEMISDGAVDLIAKDIIDNKFKGINNNKTITAFSFGTKKLYDYIDNNPSFAFMDVSYVNNPIIIAQNKNLIAINSAIEVDLTGQVCADSIGSSMYSGVGGQMDFIRGASLSDGGKAIIALPSITKRGESRIVPFLKQGAGVVTTRAHVQYIITENGIADLYGKTLRQRVNELVKIAHPTHQEAIERSYYEMIGCM